jgi:hypothetical protein
MKKLLLVVFVIATSITSFSQTSTSLKRPPTLGMSLTFNDFRTATLLRSTNLNDVFNKHDFSRFSQMSPGLTLSYSQGIYDNLDFATTLGGCFVRYPFKNRPTSNNEGFLLQADANVQLKLLDDSYFANPYLTAGVGASVYQVYYGAYIPLGAGFNFRVHEDTQISTQFQYRVGITDNTANHFNFQLGFATPLTKKN